MPSRGRSVDGRTAVRPTAFGLVVVVVVVAAAVLGPAVADPSVVGLVWAGLAGAVVFGVLWPVVTVHTVGVRVRHAPTDLVVDQLGTLEVEFTGRASGLSVACTGQPMTVLDAVAPGTVRVPFTVTRRGAYRRIRMDLGSDAPFGIVSVTRSRLVELPRQLLVGPLTEPAVARPGPLVGDDTTPQPVGAGVRGEAVRSVRPYITGDPSHLVHWPSTARTGVLVVRELEPPASEGLAVVVDLRPAAGSAEGADPDAAVERGASIAMGLVESALAAGARVLLCTAEPSGPVAAEVSDLQGARRRLALAVTGPPAEPGEVWSSVTVTPTAPFSAASPSLTGAGPARTGDERQARSTGSSATRRRPKRSADRGTISDLRVWVLTAVVALQLWAALSALPNDGARNLTAEAAALCAVLAMFGLRSVPIRWIVRGMTVVSALLLGRFGELGVFEGVTGSWRVLLWLATTATALALAPSSRAVPGAQVGIVVNAADLPGAEEHRDQRRGRGSNVPVSLLVAAVALVGASSLLIGPRTANLFPVGAKAGDVLDVGNSRSNSALVATERLDMTQRPRLSDRVVMSVRSPIAAFWRTEVFDVWDGSVWSRSRAREASPVVGGRVVPDGEDIAAVEGDASTQEFRLEAGFATAVPSAASPVRIESSAPIVQRVDGTLLAADPLGRGATYRVESRQVPVDEQRLRSVSAARVPAQVLDRYASPPEASDRVVELAQRVTAAATTDYDRVRALESWMDDNTEYSLDAPLSPGGVDVVDHFLFEERLGWCEQIASSLVVMARSVRVPARLATGFAPGEWDAAGGRFVVREREAHAWAEVWFPEVGWVAFDPTASVPLAGTQEATAGAAARDWREIGGAALLVAGVIALSAGWVRRRVTRRLGRWRSNRSHRQLVRTRWDVAEEERIERLGAAVGHARGPGTTLTTYAAAVAAITGDAEVAAAGAEVDRVRYAPAVQSR